MPIHNVIQEPKYVIYDRAVDVLGHLEYPSCSEILYYWKLFFKKMYDVFPMLFNSNFKMLRCKKKGL